MTNVGKTIRLEGSVPDHYGNFGAEDEYQDSIERQVEQLRSQVIEQQEVINILMQHPTPAPKSPTMSENLKFKLGFTIFLFSIVVGIGLTFTLDSFVPIVAGLFIAVCSAVWFS